MDRKVLEHLDLTIHFVDNHLEMDVFAKDIPNDISRKSCHPPTLFPAAVKSVGLRLRTNCSLDRFLSPRYLLSSEVMQECKAFGGDDITP